MRIDGRKIYDPNQNSRVELRHECEDYLRKRYKPGIYKGTEANNISKYLFGFYNSKFIEEIQEMDNDYFVYFTLYQYDLATKINKSFRNNQLTTEASSYWKENGPLYRRTLSYLLEGLISNLEISNNPKNTIIKAFESYDRLFILSEKAIKNSIISNEIFYLNDSYKLRINPIGSETYIETIETVKSRNYSDLHKTYVEQSTRDINLRNKYISGLPYESDWKKHGKFLNESFKEIFDLDYYEAMYLLSDIIKNSKPIECTNDIPLVNKSNFIDDIISQIGIDKDKVHRFFNGLILSKKDLRKNKRSFIKFKQEYRSNRRPFLQFEKQNTTYLTWSTEMLIERLDFLDNDFIFKNIPSEWRKGGINKAVNYISNDAGRWFEKQVKENLLKVGINGDHIKDKFHTGQESLNCKIIGGLDFLGYSNNDNILILIECKYINSGFEPKTYYNDIVSFTDPKNGYISRLDEKVEWIMDNFIYVKRDLSKRMSISIPDSCNTIGISFFTYVKTFAYAFIDNYPCISLTEFMENYEKEKKWYLKTGIIKITCA